MTEVDTFDIELGAHTEYHFRESCPACGWAREDVTRSPPAHWRKLQNPEDRLWHHGYDAFVKSSGFLEVEARATSPRQWERPARDDVCALLLRRLEHDASTPVAVEFETERGVFEFRLRPLELARGVASLRLQLEEVDVARASLGDEKDSVVEVRTHAGHRVAHVAAGRETFAVTPAETWFGAIDAMWNEQVHWRTTKIYDHLSPKLGEVYAAMTAGLGRTLGPPARHSVEPLELIAELAPEVASELRGTKGLGVDGGLLWLGPKPVGSLPFADRMARWQIDVEQHEAADVFFLEARPGRLFLQSAVRGRFTLFEESWSAAHPLGVGERLAFAWRNRGHFVDGLRLVQGQFGPAQRVRVPSDAGLCLHSVRARQLQPIVIPPTNGIVLGRAPHAPLSVEHEILGKRQSEFAVDAGGWRVRDAGSPSGTRLNGDELRGWSEPLCVGDEVMCGGLCLVVLDETGEP
ncbi:MAG: FHA domain-containing protein [Myxococcota bacterium]